MPWLQLWALVGLLLAGSAAHGGKASPQLIQVPGLGPLLLTGNSPKQAVEGLVRGLNRHRIFPGAAGQLHAWADGLNAKTGPARSAPAPSLERLRRQGKPIIAIQLSKLRDLTGHEPRYSGTLAAARAVRRAGGTPVFLPPGYVEANLGQLLRNVDHLLLLGGADLHPRLYRQRVTHAQKHRLRLGRDRHEIRVIRKAMNLGLGIDAICRGAQALNIALGGSLYQDVNLDGATERPHRKLPGARRVRRHKVQLAPTSGLSRELGGLRTIWTNSLHHQAVRRPGRGVRIVGRGRDGIVEAFEARGGRLRGYQFHPEIGRSHTSRAIFTGLVARATRRMKQTAH